MNPRPSLNYFLSMVLVTLQGSHQTGYGAEVCLQCASTSSHNDCASSPTSAIHKNCSVGLAGFRNYFCVTQTIEQKGEIIAIIRECTTDAGLGVKWCQLDETPMTGFAIKCTFICSHDLCNNKPVNLQNRRLADRNSTAARLYKSLDQSLSIFTVIAGFIIKSYNSML